MSKLLLQQVSPRQGLQWMREAFALFSRKPLALSVVLMAYLLAALVLLLVPMIGPLLAVAYLPVLSLAYMVATRKAQTNETVTPAVLLAPWQTADSAQRRHLFITCLSFAALTAGLMALAHEVDAGAFAKLQTLAAQPRTAANSAQSPTQVAAQMQALMTGPGFLAGLWIRFGGTALLSVPFWYAAALIVWHRQSTGQAMFSSTVALWRNKGAYALCALGFLGVVLAFSVFTGLFFGALGLQSVAVGAALPAGLIFTSVFYVSLYFGYRDTFAVG